jgi:hypothetical protein
LTGRKTDPDLTDVTEVETKPWEAEGITEHEWQMNQVAPK